MNHRNQFEIIYLNYHSITPGSNELNLNCSGAGTGVSLECRDSSSTCFLQLPWDDGTSEWMDIAKIYP